MQYDIVFNPDGSLNLPDLPAELIPAVEFTRVCHSDTNKSDRGLLEITENPPVLAAHDKN